MYILLVEDEAEHAILFKDYLERHGHRVDTAATRDRAVKLLYENDYDVAAIDLVLVVSTGDTVAEAAYFRGVGVVLMTAAFEETSVQDLISSLELKGCKISSKLKKPFAPKVLLMSLEQAYHDRPPAKEPKHESQRPPTMADILDDGHV